MFRWFDQVKTEGAVDSLGFRLGVELTEQMIGTNAIGTALETRHGLVVHADEHYLQAFRPYTCYGEPIIHPISRRVAGALNISGAAGAANPLFGPFLRQAVEEIQARLLDVAKPSDRRMFEAFQSEARSARRAVVALGGEVALTNRAAVDLLSPTDFPAMRLLAEGLETSSSSSVELTLSSGAPVTAEIVRIAGTTGGALIRLTPKRAPRRMASAPTMSKSTLARVLVHGAPGSGRSTEARRLAPDAGFIDCRDAQLANAGRWQQLLAHRRAEGTSILIENFELLPRALVADVRELVLSDNPERIVLTSAPISELTGAHAALAAVVSETVALPALRDRGLEIDILAQQMLKDLDPAARVRLVPSVVKALASQDWPGNLNELRTVMARVLDRRSVGDVTVDDLPPAYRTYSRAPLLAGRERAERAAIIDALISNDGNKVRAAKDLGISRTTLYARMKSLRIST